MGGLILPKVFFVCTVLGALSLRYPKKTLELLPIPILFAACVCFLSALAAICFESTLLKYLFFQIQFDVQILYERYNAYVETAWRTFFISTGILIYVLALALAADGLKSKKETITTAA